MSEIESKANDLLSERSLMLGTAPDHNGRRNWLHIRIGKFNGIQLSAQSPTGNWVRCELTPDEFGALLTYIRKAATVLDWGPRTITQFAKGQPAGMVTVGRDDDGLIYVELASPTEPAFRTVFIPLKQYMHTSNGQPAPQSEVSQVKALTWVERVGPIVFEAYKDLYRPERKGDRNQPQQRQWQGGGQQGGGQRQWQGNGQKQQYDSFPRQQNNNYQAPPTDGNLDDYINI